MGAGGVLLGYKLHSLPRPGRDMNSWEPPGRACCIPCPPSSPREQPPALLRSTPAKAAGAFQTPPYPGHLPPPVSRGHEQSGARPRAARMEGRGYKLRPVGSARKKAETPGRAGCSLCRPGSCRQEEEAQGSVRPRRSESEQRLGLQQASCSGKRGRLC